MRRTDVLVAMNQKSEQIQVARRWVVLSTVIAILSMPIGLIPLVLSILAHQKAIGGEKDTESDTSFNRINRWTIITFILSIVVMVVVWIVLAYSIRDALW